MIFDAGVTPLPVPSATGLANRGNGRSIWAISAGSLDDGEPGRRHACRSNDRLRQSLVQREGHHQRIGERVRDAVGIEQGRHLRLAGDAGTAPRQC